MGMAWDLDISVINIINKHNEQLYHFRTFPVASPILTVSCFYLLASKHTLPARFL